MIKNIIALLSLDNFYGVSENVDIAKGKNELTSNIKKVYRQVNRKYKKHGNN